VYGIVVPSWKEDMHMSSSQDRLTALIGDRIQIARKEARITQQQLSTRLGFKDRQTLSTIESGKRRVSAEELMLFMRIFGKDLDFFTDRLRLVGEGAFCWRTRGATPRALDNFEGHAKTWIATYRAMGEDLGERPSPMVRQLALTVRDSYEDASSAAEQLISEWRLGARPASRLSEVAESELKTLVLNVDPGTGISGAACHLPQFNTILVNRREVDGRRMFDFAHELFHLLTWDAMPPDRLDSDNPKRPQAKRREQLANHFAASLLMPRESVLALWAQRNGQDIHAWLNASAEVLCVTALALKYRIFNMELIDEGDLLEIYDDRLTYNGKEPSESLLPQLFSHAFVDRLATAIDRGFISVRRAARMLGVSGEDFEDLIRAYGIEPPFEL
jgi:XRE family transcriptional regulator, fatty acid utilization regulator